MYILLSRNFGSFVYPCWFELLRRGSTNMEPYAIWSQSDNVQIFITQQSKMTRNNIFNTEIKKITSSKNNLTSCIHVNETQADNKHLIFHSRFNELCSEWNRKLQLTQYFLLACMQFPELITFCSQCGTCRDNRASINMNKFSDL